MTHDTHSPAAYGPTSPPEPDNSQCGYERYPLSPVAACDAKVHCRLRTARLS